MYPLVILDNFYDDPDSIVDIANSIEYSPSEDGRWPGVRSKPMWEVDRDLYVYTAEKILYLFNKDLPQYWEFEMEFQKTSPYSEDQYHSKNKGWIHPDKGVTYFGGVIFLNKNPDKDTGLSIYKEKRGYSIQNEQEMLVKEKHYRGEHVPDVEYYEAYKKVHDQYEETVSISNVYNRMILFNTTTYHGVQTFGVTQDRLTLVFFCQEQIKCKHPLYR